MSDLRQRSCVDRTCDVLKRHTSSPSRRSRAQLWTIITLLTTCAVGQPVGDGFTRLIQPINQLVSRATQPLLDVFQVYPPVLTVVGAVLEISDGSSSRTVGAAPEGICTETLVSYSFANSYGQPYVGTYEPPSCSFNRVTWNLTVTAAGRQFDRLASVSFGDIELFRTSTAEPTANGIVWTYLKDMTNFLSLFQQSQTIIFELGNIVDNTYTAPFNVELTATYFTAESSVTPADLIVPVSKRQGANGQPSHFDTPSDTATNSLSLPRNVKKAIFTVAATGQAAEEFWWSNVPQSTIDTFPSTGTLYGYSPFREVELFINGQLAGVVFPYPVIFTGGVVPGLWRPIVGIDAFDLKEDEIDITPWLGVLCDGNKHNFTLRVSGLDDDGNGTSSLSGTTLDEWWVDGKIFIWLDEDGHVTTGAAPHLISSADFAVHSTVLTSTDGTNATLLYNVSAARDLSISSVISLSTGLQPVSWSQSLTYSNIGNYSGQGETSTNQQQTSGKEISSSGYARSLDYPLYAESTYTTDADNFTIAAYVERGKTTWTFGQPVFPTGLEPFTNTSTSHRPRYQGAFLTTTQSGNATYEANQTAKTSYSFGSTQQDMTFAGVRAPVEGGTDELFRRSVLAVNGSVVSDDETLIGVSFPVAHAAPAPAGIGGASFALSGFPARRLLQEGGW